MTPPITHNTGQHRFEADLGSERAILEYRLSPGFVTFTHTEVPPEHEGRGIGMSLVEAGVAYARQQRLKIVPRCPFVAAILNRHPEDYADVLSS